MLAGCTGPLSTLDPAGPAATSIAELWWVMLIAGLLLQALVVALLWLAFARPGIGTWMTERNFIIAGGLVLPGVTLPALLVYALVLGERLLPHPPAGEVLQIRAHAQQFFWTFEYREAGQPVRSVDVLHLPVGRPVDMLLTSGDVIHSFWIPRLAGKIDAIPGHENVIRIQADRPGTYRGQCSEFCGIGHARMQFVAHAHHEEDYLAAVRRLAEEGPAPEPKIPAPERQP
jgi:cytochrome c oxidase subunit II